MSKKLKVTGLKLETKDGKSVSLTLAEAKELHDQLDELFGKEIRYLPTNPIYVPDRPWRDTRPYYNWTCGSISDNTAGVSYSNNTGMTLTYLSNSTGH